MSPAARRGLILFLVGLVFILGAFAYDYWQSGDAGGIGGLSIGGPFTLTDQNGVLRRDSDFRGKLMLVYFGYTYCPDVCPATLNTITAALDKLGARADAVQPIFITVDPARDTVQQMKLYVANFTPRLLALTGTPGEIAAAAKGYRIYFQKVKGEGPDDYSMDHSAFVYLMGRDGRYLAHFGPEVGAAEMAAAIQKYL
ncbi:MAG TPA: SCO family protein [Stellaceae bacterium]|jgi:protein SCO1/2|nr:SCO family protein [Stellaceae bacterium]